MPARPLDWPDARSIAIELEEAHPEAEILQLRFTELRRMVLELPGFGGDPRQSSEKVLEAIQMAWLDERD